MISCGPTPCKWPAIRYFRTLKKGTRRANQTLHYRVCAIMWELLYFGAVLVLAACFALTEVQIEGPDGWAAKLPTWRLKGGWFDRFFPGRPLTGYHLWTLVFIALVAHLPFAFRVPWTWYGEFRAIAFVLFFWVIEDFLWFVLNPHYGLKRFGPRHIAWHRATWWWIAPRDYWIALTIGIAFYWLSRREPPMTVVMTWP
ncbi:MAG: hypothetical protein HZB38_12775 [Planctomycetes bacterium]|nr:hypothetical protein [Planctomycetota bacterium]